MGDLAAEPAQASLHRSRWALCKLMLAIWFAAAAAAGSSATPEQGYLAVTEHQRQLQQLPPSSIGSSSPAEIISTANSTTSHLPTGNFPVIGGNGGGNSAGTVVSPRPPRPEEHLPAGLQDQLQEHNSRAQTVTAQFTLKGVTQGGYEKSYLSAIRAVVADLSGTTADSWQISAIPQQQQQQQQQGSVPSTSLEPPGGSAIGRKLLWKLQQQQKVANSLAGHFPARLLLQQPSDQQPSGQQLQDMLITASVESLNPELVVWRLTQPPGSTICPKNGHDTGAEAAAAAAAAALSGCVQELCARLAAAGVPVDGASLSITPMFTSLFVTNTNNVVNSVSASTTDSGMDPRVLGGAIGGVVAGVIVIVIALLYVRKVTKRKYTAGKRVSNSSQPKDVLTERATAAIKDNSKQVLHVQASKTGTRSASPAAAAAAGWKDISPSGDAIPRSPGKRPEKGMSKPATLQRPTTSTAADAAAASPRPQYHHHHNQQQQQRQQRNARDSTVTDSAGSYAQNVDEQQGPLQQRHMQQQDAEKKPKQ